MSFNFELLSASTMFPSDGDNQQVFPENSDEEFWSTLDAQTSTTAQLDEAPVISTETTVSDIVRTTKKIYADESRVVKVSKKKLRKFIEVNNEHSNLKDQTKTLSKDLVVKINKGLLENSKIKKYEIKLSELKDITINLLHKPEYTKTLTNIRKILKKSREKRINEFSNPPAKKQKSTHDIIEQTRVTTFQDNNEDTTVSNRIVRAAEESNADEYELVEVSKLYLKKCVDANGESENLNKGAIPLTKNLCDRMNKIISKDFYGLNKTKCRIYVYELKKITENLKFSKKYSHLKALRELKNCITNSESLAIPIAPASTSDQMIMTVSKLNLDKCIEENKNQGLLTEKQHQKIKKDLEDSEFQKSNSKETKCLIYLSDLESILKNLKNPNHMVDISNMRRVLTNQKQNVGNHKVLPHVNNQIDHYNFIKVSKTTIGNCVKFFNDHELLSNKQKLKYADLINSIESKAEGSNNKKIGDGLKYPIKVDELEKLLLLPKNKKHLLQTIEKIKGDLSKLRNEIKKFNDFMQSTSEQTSNQPVNQIEPRDNFDQLMDLPEEVLPYMQVGNPSF